ncbi:MAG: hypothetical protein ING03_10450 [Roseomonas sp.]|nr:hypothetical protein [Roseomonas sp.]MCA3311909.1 hypothetical protein [Roseomonas sp.]MCA3318566.1 hypothetical protein [Roseomonas sp.]MCA3320221.1 hypothetical protein [Roseomonas sp.]MCA3344031.1 hypothetical protein [Roseomonas sp.]
MPAPEPDVVPAPADAAYARKPQKALLHRIEQMQGDALLLLDHLAKRPERRFSLAQEAGQPGTEEGGKWSSITLGPLMKTPAEIAEDPKQFSELVQLLDELARRASPATPQTILKSSKAFNWADFLLVVAMLLAFVVSIAGLLRVDEGRKLVQDTRAVQAAAQESYRKLFMLKPEDHFLICLSGPARMVQIGGQMAPGFSEGFCFPKGIGFGDLNDAIYCEQGGGGKASSTHLKPMSREALSLCSELSQHKVREQILFARMNGWNCELTEWRPVRSLLSLRIGAVDSLSKDFLDAVHLAQYSNCAVGSSKILVDHLSPVNQHWERSEFRLLPLMHLINQHILPAGLALLGAATSLLLIRYQQRKESVLWENSWIILTKLMIPTTIGALLGLLWSSPIDAINATQIKVGEFSFILGVLAFFFGFTFEACLDWLKRKIGELLNGKPKEENQEEQIRIS